MSFPPGTEMFQFPGFASLVLCIQTKITRQMSDANLTPGKPDNQINIRICRVGFPHSEIPGSKVVRTSPGLIAAYHVFHRLCAPRHPLETLVTLDSSISRGPHRQKMMRPQCLALMREDCQSM